MDENKKVKFVNDLTVGSVPKQLIAFATPLFFSGLLQTVYNMVDMIIVGKVVGSAGLSAVSIGGEILTLLTFIAMGFASAGQIIISQLLGAKQKDKVRALIGTMFTFLTLCALGVTVICFFAKDFILNWLNTPAEAFAYARSYVVVCVFGLIFIYGYNLVSAILRGMGDSKHPFVFIAIAAVTNLILDIIFVVFFKWAAFGAALATVIGQGVSFTFSIFFLLNHKEQFDFDFKLSSFKIEKESFISLLKLGTPMVLRSAAITFSKLYVSSWLNSYGLIASAVSGIGNKLQSVTNVFTNAISTAGGSMIAQNIGAEKYERVPKIISTSFIIDGIIAGFFTIITLAFPRAVFGLFNSEEAVLDMAMTFVPVCILLYAAGALRPPMFSLINGSGNYKLNFAIGILDGIVMRIGLALLMGVALDMGIYGFWYGDAFSGFVPFFIGGVYYISGKWKTRKYIINEG